MKEINERYSNVKIDGSRYATIPINGASNNNDKNIVFVPYILREHTEESLAEYNESKRLYKIEHEVCPKCGATEHSTTLVTFIGNDLNRCGCLVCGDNHTTHDRISKEVFKSRLVQINN